MSVIHVLTPLTRPENLQAMEASLAEADRNTNGEFTLIWHVLPDPSRRSLGGYSLRNEALDVLRSPFNWIWMLDDDTIAHPLILRRLATWDRPEVSAMIIGQTRPAGWNPGCADPARLRNGAHTLAPDECAFDTGQVIFRRHLIGAYRFRTADRSGDGWFYEEILAKAPDVVYVDEVLSYYNALR